MKNENTKNNQSSDVVNPSPFLLFGYPIIKGFSLESMHTIEHGAFGRAINGLAYEKRKVRYKQSQKSRPSNKVIRKMQAIQVRTKMKDSHFQRPTV